MGLAEDDPSRGSVASETEGGKGIQATVRRREQQHATAEHSSLKSDGGAITVEAEKAQPAPSKLRHRPVEYAGVCPRAEERDGGAVKASPPQV